MKLNKQLFNKLKQWTLLDYFMTFIQIEVFLSIYYCERIFYARRPVFQGPDFDSAQDYE